MDKSRNAWKQRGNRVCAVSEISWWSGGKAVGSFWVFHKRRSRRVFLFSAKISFFTLHFSRVKFFLRLWKSGFLNSFKPSQNVVVNCGMSCTFIWTMSSFSVFVEILIHIREGLKTLTFLSFLNTFVRKIVDKISFPQGLWKCRWVTCWKLQKMPFFSCLLP